MIEQILQKLAFWLLKLSPTDQKLIIALRGGFGRQARRLFEFWQSEVVRFPVDREPTISDVVSATFRSQSTEVHFSLVDKGPLLDALASKNPILEALKRGPSEKTKL